MAPKKGGGSSSGGSSSGGSSSSGSDSSYDSYDSSNSSYDSSSYDSGSSFDGYLAAVYANIVFSALVILAAVVALALVLKKSWVRDTGKKNIPRLVTFLCFLGAVVVSRAINVSVLANEVRSYNNSYDIFYSSLGTGDVVGQIAASTFFYVAAAILAYTIITIEIFRGNGHVSKKSTVGEIIIYAVIGFLLIIDIAAWGVATRMNDRVLSVDSVDSLVDSILALRGLLMTYNVIALLFSIGILVAAFTNPSGESITNSRKRFLQGLAGALFIGQVLELAGTAVAYYGDSYSGGTASLALQATSEVFWIIKIIIIALLARDSFNSYHSGSGSGNVNTHATGAPPMQPQMTGPPPMSGPPPTGGPPMGAPPMGAPPMGAPMWEKDSNTSASYSTPPPPPPNNYGPGAAAP